MSASGTADRRWLFSPAVDLGVLAAPLLLAFAALAFVPADFGRPLWAYVLFIVSFDVAHVWSTGHLTYFRRDRFAARPVFLTAVVPITFLCAFAAHRWSPVAFWSAVAYVAIGHFIKQQWGFVALYAAKAGEARGWNRRLDALALWVGALGPLALWHADPDDAFQWFDAGEDFALRLPEAVSGPVLVGMAVVAAAWVAKELVLARERHPSAGKIAWMVGSWVSWWFGLRVAPNFLVATAFINLVHGIPYTALVWWRARRTVGARRGPRAPALRFAFVFYAPLLGLALLEEGLWERYVWQAYADVFSFSAAALEATWLSVAVAFLSLPQLVHYVLDGVLWRAGDPSNDDLRAAISNR